MPSEGSIYLRGCLSDLNRYSSSGAEVKSVIECADRRKRRKERTVLDSVMSRAWALTALEEQAGGVSV